MVASIKATPIATIEGPDRATTQQLLTEAVARWRAAGTRVVGLMEERHGLSDRTCNAGVLRDIVSGKYHSIYLEIPRPGTSCHIDAAGAASAGAAIIEQIDDCDLAVLSKFGKLEAVNGGLIGAFEAAVRAGKPILTTVSSLHREAWHAFAPTATRLPAEAVALEAWWREVHPLAKQLQQHH